LSSASQDRRIDYVEFSTRDLAAAKKFYAAAFGWVFTDYAPDYSSFTDGRLSGGFVAKPGAPRQMNPLVVLFAADLEATQARVVAAGGVISLAAFEFPGGRRFHFTDPAGLELAVWSDRRADGSIIS
jgi:predicted enzyme related to lactoylglutathione lyase